MTESPSAQRFGRFGDLLKQARQNIPKNAVSLGNVLRLPHRVGRLVSQEELAEVLEVSRVWYATLELGRVQPSVALLERICDVLMLDERQRSTAVELAVPEFSPLTAALRHTAVLQASARIRSTANRLWSASTVEEALTIAAEESTAHFTDAALVFFVHRVAPGRWEYPFVVDHGMGTRNANSYAELALTLTPNRFDEIVLYPALARPGDVGTIESYETTSVADEYKAALANHKLQRWVFLHARIHSRDGTIAGITVKHATEHVYSETERASISTIASLTSLALS